MKAKLRTIGPMLMAVLIFSSAALLTLGVECRNPSPASFVAVRSDGLIQPQEPAQPKTNPREGGQGTRREENKRPPDATIYSYEFTQPQFYIHHILIEHNATGKGRITFEHLGDSTPITEPIELSTGALGRVLGLWVQLGFL